MDDIILLQLDCPKNGTDDYRTGVSKLDISIRICAINGN